MIAPTAAPSPLELVTPSLSGILDLRHVEPRGPRSNVRSKSNPVRTAWLLRANGQWDTVAAPWGNDEDEETVVDWFFSISGHSIYTSEHDKFPRLGIYPISGQGDDLAGFDPEFVYVAEIGTRDRFHNGKQTHKWSYVLLEGLPAAMRLVEMFRPFLKTAA